MNREILIVVSILFISTVVFATELKLPTCAIGNETIMGTETTPPVSHFDGGALSIPTDDIPVNKPVSITQKHPHVISAKRECKSNTFEAEQPVFKKPNK